MIKTNCFYKPLKVDNANIMGPICHVFNMSYKTGYIPTILAKTVLINSQITDQLVYFHLFQNF